MTDDMILHNHNASSIGISGTLVSEHGVEFWCYPLSDNKREVKRIREVKKRGLQGGNSLSLAFPEPLQT